MDSTQSSPLKTEVQTIQRQLIASKVDFKSGDCAGPFVLTDEKKSIKITLVNFTGEPMDLEMEKNEVTCRIQSIPSPLLANCVILQTGKMIQIMFTRDIISAEPLRAILVADMNYRIEKDIEENDKQYECSKCHKAKLNSSNNLKVHEELYCTKDLEINRVEEKAIPQNLILLPLSYHKLLQKDAVQVIGPVHTMVPVAIGRKSTLINTNPIFIQNRANLDIPANLNIAHPNITISIPIFDLDEKIPSTSTALDLSTTSRAASVISLSPSCSPASKSSSNEPFYPDRPFSCTCGVSFSSQATFDAHRQLYCSHTTRDSSYGGGPNRNDASRKVPGKCGKCDFVPNSSSQLSMHIRSSHQITKTFTCLVCGYRAFSMRGVRTHMRSHSNDDAQKFKANDSEEA